MLSMRAFVHQSQNLLLLKYLGNHLIMSIQPGICLPLIFYIAGLFQQLRASCLSTFTS